MGTEQEELSRVLDRYRRGRYEAAYTAQLLEGLITKLDQGRRNRVLSSLWAELSTDFQRAVKGESVQNWIFPVTIPCWLKLGDTALMARQLLAMLIPNAPGVARAWTTHVSGLLCDALYRHYDRFAHSAIVEVEAWMHELKFAMGAGVSDHQLEPDLVRVVNRIGEIIEDKRSEPLDQALLVASGVTRHPHTCSSAAPLHRDAEVDLARSYKSDAFISHASEDKESFVTPLVEELQKYGLKVWFDKFALKVGDSLRRSIEDGLATSRYGVVILSPSFFAKNWTQTELNGLFAREMEGPTVILPVWHQVTKLDLLQRAPMLADKKAANSQDGIAAVAKELVCVIRPEALDLDITQANAQRVNARLLELLSERNPGLDFRVSVGPTPVLPSLDSELPLPKGTVASAFHLGMQIDIMAKDREEYCNNPIKVSLRFRGTGVTKIQEALRTGKVQEFTSEEFSDVKTSLRLFAPLEGSVVGQKLVLAPSRRAMKSLPVGGTFTGNGDTVQFPYLQMRGERGGTDEVSVVVEGQNVPFLLRLILALDGPNGGNIEIEPQIIGAEIHALQKYSRALRVVQNGGVIEIRGLETDSAIFSGSCKLEGPTEKQDHWHRMVDDIALVSDYFGLSLKWPAAISEQDAERLLFLKCFIAGAPIGKGASFTSVLKKTKDNTRLFETMPPSGQVWLQKEDPIVFFGTPIKDRALFLFMEEVRIVDLDKVRDRFTHAAVGEEIDICYKTDSDLMVKVWDKSNPRTVEQSAAPHPTNGHVK